MGLVVSGESESCVVVTVEEDWVISDGITVNTIRV